MVSLCITHWYGMVYKYSIHVICITIPRDGSGGSGAIAHHLL